MKGTRGRGLIKGGILIFLITLIYGCTTEKTEIVLYCANNPDDPLCKPPSNPCQLYPELYFYCIAVDLPKLEEVCKEHPDWDVCDALSPENLCQLHPEWSICQPSGPNYPPVITAVLSKSCGSAGEVITIDASQSNDPEGDPLSFKWEIVNGGGRFLTSSTAPAVDFELPIDEGDTMLKLTVSDGKGGSDEEIFVLHSMGLGIFVSPSGDDANPGTYSQPVSSITKGLQLAYSKGITDVNLLEGEYSESVNFEKGGVRLKGGYYNDGGCWVRDYENHYTVINGRGDYVLQMTSVVTDYVLIEGVYISGATGPTTTIKGIMVDGAGDVTVKDSYIYGGDGKYAVGIWVKNAGAFRLINSRVYGGKSSTLSSSANAGVKVENTYAVGITGSIIDGGDTRGNSTSTRFIYGIYISSGITRCRIENSVIFGGRGYNSNKSLYPYDFYTVGISTGSQCEIYHNYIYGGDPEEDVTDNQNYRSGASIGIYLVLNSPGTLKIVNNIIDPGGAYNDSSSLRYGVYDYYGIAPNYTFKNNDIYSSVPYLPGDTPILYNDGGTLYLNASSLNNIDGAGGNFDGNLSVDPLLDLDGIHLTPNSPLIDAGYGGDAGVVLPSFDIDGDLRPMGGKYDIGPDELR